MLLFSSQKTRTGTFAVDLAAAVAVVVAAVAAGVGYNPAVRMIRDRPVDIDDEQEIAIGPMAAMLERVERMYDD